MRHRFNIRSAGSYWRDCDGLRRGRVKEDKKMPKTIEEVFYEMNGESRARYFASLSDDAFWSLKGPFNHDEYVFYKAECDKREVIKRQEEANDQQRAQTLKQRKDALPYSEP